MAVSSLDNVLALIETISNIKQPVKRHVSNHGKHQQSLNM